MQNWDQKHLWGQIIIKNQNGEMYFYDQYQFEDPVFMDARKKGKKKGKTRKNGGPEEYQVL
jgi:hypothetical protein